jgi:hypothetical protein
MGADLRELSHVGAPMPEPTSSTLDPVAAAIIAGSRLSRRPAHHHAVRQREWARGNLDQHATYIAADLPRWREDRGLAFCAYRTGAVLALRDRVDRFRTRQTWLANGAGRQCSASQMRSIRSTTSPVVLTFGEYCTSKKAWAAPSASTAFVSSTS